MGALPGGRLLSAAGPPAGGPSTPHTHTAAPPVEPRSTEPRSTEPRSTEPLDPSVERWFDVDAYRSTATRRAVVWHPDRTVLVLGSTQRLVIPAARAGMTVVRRRSGGGAVLVVPGETVWVDLWLPRDDPLWDDDVVRAADWVGRWWATGLGAALGGVGAVAGTPAGPDLRVHRGPSMARPWSDLFCFAGVGPGEVLADRRKVVGLAQWRSRQGALFQACCYRRWEAGVLAGLLDRAEATAALQGSAVGLDELASGPTPAADAVTDALLRALPGGRPWDVAS